MYTKIKLALSGLKINFHKSAFALLRKCNNSLSLIREIFRCEEATFPIKYMGITIKPERLSRQDWSLIFDSLERKLGELKGKLLSAGGRIIMFNSALSASPLYCMSLFILPCWVQDRINRIRSRFL